MTWQHLPPPARAVAVAAADAVAAATDHDPERLDAAVAHLSAAEGTGLVLGTVVRLLLERHHPQGLDGSDVQAVLADSVRAAAAWQPEVDPHLMLVLLAGALGVDVDDGAPAPAPAALARHAALLVAHLLPPGQGVDGPLAAAFAEIERTQRHA